MKHRGVDLVVVVNGFPRLSETFVLQELLELERRGVRLSIVALRRPEEDVIQEDLALLRAKVTYLPDLAAKAERLAVRTAHAALLLGGRQTYLDGLARTIASQDFSRTNLDRAALLGHHVRRLGSPSMYLHFAHKPATIGRFAALLTGVSYGLSAHAKDIWLTPPRELAAKVRDAEIVLTCTREGRDHLATAAGTATPVRLVHHGVCTAHTHAAERDRNPVPVVLAVGRLVPKKGYATLLHAAAGLRDRGTAFRLRIVGEGPEWSRLQRLVHALDLADHVAFLGPLTPAEVTAEMQGADVFALACERLADGDRDGIPNVILEAMAQGLPIVSTNLLGVAEAVVHGESGLLSEQGDVDALAANLERLITDAKMRTHLGEAARARVSACFDRRRLLPLVGDALAAAGLITARRAAHAGVPSLRRAA